MKPVLAISFALLLLLKPLWPIGEYIVNYDYIVNTLCKNKEAPELKCNGKCYLSELLAMENSAPEENPFEGARVQSEWTEIIYPILRFTMPVLWREGPDVGSGFGYLEALNPTLHVLVLINPPEPEA